MSKADVHADFKRWWKKHGYNPDIEMLKLEDPIDWDDAMILIRYWAWKAYEAGASGAGEEDADDNSGVSDR